MKHECLNCIKPRKVAIIGCGFVGSTCAFTLMQSGLFTEIVLLDDTKEKAEGEAMDISHGVSFSSPVKIYAGTYSDIKDASLIIITAGRNQQPNETRLELVESNIVIMQNIISEINMRAFDCILLIVSNPVDILTTIAQKLSQLPPKQILGSGTVLDTARLKYEIGKYLSVDPRSVHSYIIGEHGDSEIPVWSSANIAGIPIDKFCEMRHFLNYQRELKNIAISVKNSAYEIIKKKKATYYGIAMSIKRICEALVFNEKAILPISSVLNGEYEINNVALSLPAIIGKDGVEAIIPINLNNSEEKRLKLSADNLQNILVSNNIRGKNERNNR